MEHVHLLAESGAPRTLCGIKTKLKEALPFMLARHLAAHEAGHGAVACPACLAAQPLTLLE